MKILAQLESTMARRPHEGDRGRMDRLDMARANLTGYRSRLASLCAAGVIQGFCLLRARSRCSASRPPARGGWPSAADACARRRRRYPTPCRSTRTARQLARRAEKLAARRVADGDGGRIASLGGAKGRGLERRSSAIIAGVGSAGWGSPISTQQAVRSCSFAGRLPRTAMHLHANHGNERIR